MTGKIIKKKNSFISIKIKFNKIKINENIKTINFKGFNLPNTMDYEEWGEIISEEDRTIRIKKYNSKLYYEILVADNSTFVKLKFKDKILLEFKDRLIEIGSSSEGLLNRVLLSIQLRLNLCEPIVLIFFGLF